jgi:hypothetical protein
MSNARNCNDRSQALENRTCGTGCVNCCIAGVMSRCGAGPLVSDQRTCTFFKQATHADRCMHYCISLDGHCDCVEAQVELKRFKP